MNASRRKQNRPNRASVTSSSTNSPSASPESPPNSAKSHAEDDFEVSSSTPLSRNEEFAFPVGTTLGPFPVRTVSADDSEEIIFTTRDVANRCVSFALSGAESYSLKQLSSASSATTANATVSSTSEGDRLFLRILVTKPANSFSELSVLYVDAPPESPERQSRASGFTCALCRTASFSSMENLKTHQHAYCQPTNGTVITDTQFSNVMTQLMRTPMFPLPILLPVAFHNQSDPSMVQLIGNPQVFVPVAVHRGPAQFRSAPLILSQEMTQNVEVPTSLAIGDNKAFDLRIVTVAANGSIVENPPPQPSPTSEVVEPKSKRARLDDASDDVLEPLDLSKKTTKTSRTNSVSYNSAMRKAISPKDASLRCFPVNLKTTSSVEAVSSAKADSTEKPFACDCGVSFSNRETLLGHQRFYCRNRPGADDPPREPVRKNVNFSCPHRPCGFEAGSSAQLQNHIRQQHNTVRGYMCKFCGYKGQSSRGMRSHLKEHEHLTASPEMQNENELILEITKDTPMYTCAACRIEFPLIFQSKHRCIETIILS